MKMFKQEDNNNWVPFVARFKNDSFQGYVRTFVEHPIELNSLILDTLGDK